MAVAAVVGNEDGAHHIPPEAVASATKTLAANAAHLAQLLRVSHLRH